MNKDPFYPHKDTLYRRIPPPPPFFYTGVYDVVGWLVGWTRVGVSIVVGGNYTYTEYSGVLEGLLRDKGLFNGFWRLSDGFYDFRGSLTGKGSSNGKNEVQTL
jgi:hypothetical protein